MPEKEVGRVTHFFTRIGVAAITLTDTLKVGDTIRIVGGTRDFQQQVESMEIEHEPVEKAEAGQEIGIKVIERARENDRVHKVE